MRPLAVYPGRLFLSSLATLFLAGCSDRTADLQQQITSLQNELDRARAEVVAVQKQMAETPPPVGSSSDEAGNSAGTSRESVERSYEEAARVFRTGLEAELPEVQMGNFTLYRPEVELFPYRSEFSMEVRLRGKPVQIERIPVKAGLDGKWTFPTVAEVGSLIERLKDAPPPAFPAASTIPQPEPVGAGPAPERRTETSIAAPAAANQTVVVQWGDAPAGRPAASPDAPLPARAGSPAAAPAPAAPPPAGPTRVMPAARDVQIKF